jgi:glycosyltransferase involved in cell wall biosynthesis
MITPWYPDDQSPNSGVFIRSQAAALAVNHEVVVIVSKVNYKQFGLHASRATIAAYQNVRENRLMVYKSLPLYNQINFWWTTLGYSLRIARTFKPDIIHASIGYPGAFWGWYLSRRLKVPFILQEHTRVKNNFRSWFHKMTTLFGLKRADALLAVGHSLAAEIESVTNRSCMIMPNIVETERFSPAHLSDGIPWQIGFLGTLNTPVKGLDILLESLAGIGHPFQLHIGGAGMREDDYKTLAQKLGIAQHCIFYGFIPVSDIPAFMRKFHFFVCASRYETFCVALVEAMAAGLPVISTRCGGPEDFVKDLNGILVDKENTQALQLGLAKMMDNYRQYDRDQIRAYAHDNFSRGKFLERIDKIYQQVLS